MTMNATRKIVFAIAALFFGLAFASASSANACQSSYGYGYQSYDNGYGY
jgi:hypothetical protein